MNSERDLFIRSRPREDSLDFLVDPIADLPLLTKQQELACIIAAKKAIKPLKKL